MPRYVIERAFDPMDPEVEDQLGAMSKSLIEEKYPQIRWEHSHVVSDAEGNVKSFCVYEAPDEECIRAHAKDLGHHLIQTIYEIGADINPRDIKSA
jgi:uncharacterized protein DUF4242